MLNFVSLLVSDVTVHTNWNNIKRRLT